MRLEDAVKTISEQIQGIEKGEEHGLKFSMGVFVVYSWWHDGQLVYIGSGEVSRAATVAGHFVPFGISGPDFFRIHLMSKDRLALHNIEQKLINIFSPPWNKNSVHPADEL